jgi:hypothetical protein
MTQTTTGAVPGFPVPGAGVRHAVVPYPPAPPESTAPVSFNLRAARLRPQALSRKNRADTTGAMALESTARINR